MKANTERGRLPSRRGQRRREGLGPEVRPIEDGGSTGVRGDDTEATYRLAWLDRVEVVQPLPISSEVRRPADDPWEAESPRKVWR